MIKASALVAYFWYVYQEVWGYIYGALGQVWTKAKQKAATRAQTIKWGEQWIGHRVVDCSGLGVLAFRDQGGNLYHGSNTIWNKYVCCRSEMKNGSRTDGGQILPSDPVFKRRKEGGDWNRHHIGYYVGGDQVIEAKGTYYGVVISSLREWDETAHWKNVEYEGGVIFVAYPTIRKGDSGADVQKLQQLLQDRGYDLGASGADGKYGEKTREAVLAFQRSAGIQADGIAGDQTWTALIEHIPPDTEADADLVDMPREKLEEIKASLSSALSEIEQALTK